MHHRFFTPSVLVAGSSIELTGEEHHHAARVARVRAGEAIELFDGKGTAAAASVQSVDRDRLVVLVGDPLPSREPALAITLAMAIVQLERFELVLQKATELGAARIIPLVTDRIELRPERYRGKAERWQKIVFEAVKQCGRARIPEVTEPETVDAVLARGGVPVVLDADEPPASAFPDGEPTLLVGPEGGWSERELAAARAAGAAFARIGPRRLRAETAGIAAMVAVGMRIGDLGTSQEAVRPAAETKMID